MPAIISSLYTCNTYTTTFSQPTATTSSGYLLRTNAQGEQLWTDGTNEYSFAELMAKSFTDNASFSPDSFGNNYTYNGNTNINTMFKAINKYNG